MVVLWKISPLIAGWLASRNNILFQHGLLGRDSTILELGSGTSGVTALTISPHVKNYICTDQKYALGLLERNLSENRPKKKNVSVNKKSPNPFVGVLPFDWELDSAENVFHLLRSQGIDVSNGFDAVLACDCIYNPTLVKPFVHACRDVCRLRQALSESRPTLCIIAQQLRSHDVMEEWLNETLDFFHIWRVPDELLDKGLRENTGFVVHHAILKTPQQPPT